MASDQVEFAAEDRAYYPGRRPAGAAPKLFKDGDKAWLRATNDRPNIRVTILQSAQNPGTKKWEYQIEDNEHSLVGSGDGWVTQAELSQASD
ncbi:hypothetical protein E2P81_ATG01500 [Venturia nashicola]|nr:hypothetical protein E2P81_ATG01500 [Venturia nashicola]